MAGANSIIRVVAAPLVITIVIFVGWVGVKLMDSIVPALGNPPSALGWPDVDFYLYMALGLIGLVLVVFVWLWKAPIREDTRQDVRQGGPF